MRTPPLLSVLFAAGLALAIAGCSKSDTPKSPETVKTPTEKAVDATKDVANPAATAVKDTVQKTAETTADAANKSAEAIKDAAATTAQTAREQTAAVQTAATKVSAEITTAFENAKKLLSEGKWQEAAKALEPLGNLKLTAEQQALLDQLKKQIAQLQAGGQKAADEAAKAVGNLLKK